MKARIVAVTTGVLLVAALPARGAPDLVMRAHREGVRFDLGSGAPLDGAPEDAVVLPEPVALRAVRDEVVALQVLISGASSTVAVTVRAPASVDVSVFAERALALGAHRYPDALVPTSTAVVPASPGVALLWVDVWVHPDAPAGPARIELTVAGARTLIVELEILPLTLGALPGFAARSVGAAWPADTTRAWAQILHAHAIDLEVDARDEASTGALFTPERGYRGPRVGVPPSWVHITAPTDALVRWIGALELTPPPGTATCFVDAPPIKDAADVATVVAWGEQLKGLPEALRKRLVYRVRDAFGRDFDDLDDAEIAQRLGPVVDAWIVTGSVRGSPWNVLEARREADHSEKFMFRSGPDAGLPATPPLGVEVPAAHARAWGWIAHAYGLDGALIDAVDASGGCAARPPCADRAMAEALVWRSEDLGLAPGRFLPSLRLKGLRRGAQDAALLARLDADDADTARALGDIMVPSAMGDEQTNVPEASWPLSPVEYDRARDQILDRLAGTTPPEALAEVRPEIPSDPVRRYGGWPVVIAVGAILVVLIARGAARASRS